MTDQNTPWLIVLYIGASECIWLGICMVLSPWYKVAPALFSPIDAAYVIPVGIICLVAGVIGFVKPDSMGGGALVLACGLRIIQSISVTNVYPVGVWLILLGALLAVYFRSRKNAMISGVSLKDIMATLERRGTQQAEERDRQMREGERQTIEGERQTREGIRQTAEGDRLRAVRINEGVRQTTEGERQTVEGDRQTREGERQTIDAARLDELKGVIELQRSPTPRANVEGKDEKES